MTALNQPVPPAGTKAGPAQAPAQSPAKAPEQAAQAPVVAAPVAVPRDVDTSKLKGSSLTNAERIPSNWNITPVEGNKIEATNIHTNRVFEGTIKEFNEMLRSQA